MPHTIQLQCFNADFSCSTSIDLSLLENVVAKREDLKFEREEGRTTLAIWKDEDNDWWPLLWVSADYAYINSDPIFESGLYYDLVGIAESVDASIITEDGIFLFIPKYGLLYDPDENEDIELEIGALQEEIKRTENLALAIKSIVSKKAQKSRVNQEVVRDKQKKLADQHALIKKIEAKQHYIGIAVFVVLILLLILKKMR